ncbi:MAG: N-acetyl-alpha-D-glucosaminyl L-malate synthase BshA [Cytophagales bacterium]|nr:N-acetyl-alpha-D-glucosaminyl L-malate synthase BshA [Cytophagales bacterium]
MKIGIVCYPTFGGSGVVATELGKALAQKGNEVHFITYSLPQRLDFFSENVYYHEVTMFKYPLFEYPPYELALASKIVDVALHVSLDVLHVHYAIPHASAAYMAKQILQTKHYHLPIITTLHGTDITLVGKAPQYEPVVTFSINASDAVTAVSNDLKTETLQLFNITNEISVIPNFIDLTRFKKQKKEHFRNVIAPKGEKILVHTSNFRKVKRIDDLVKVFANVCNNIPSKLLLVGDGPERTYIENLCRELQIEEHVRFLGKLDVVEEILSVCDLFLLPSETESFGLAALEAMACELPVVASNAGGIPEVVEHGKSGLLSEVGDIEDMAKNVLHILQNDNIARYKSGALLRAKEFELAKILPLYETVYQTVIKK